MGSLAISPRRAFFLALAALSVGGAQASFDPATGAAGPHASQRPRALNDTTNYLPRWSPAGDRLAFMRREHGVWRIHVIGVDGTGLVRLGDAGPHHDREPNWSPDGTRLVFDSDRRGHRDIHALSISDNRVTRLTDDAAEDKMAAWSPDGRQIVFVSNRSGSRELWLMSADGARMRQLTTSGAPNVVPRPSWSPDGRLIAYASERQPTDLNPLEWRQILLITPDGRLRDPITAPAFPGNQQWSPDGRRLVFDDHPGGVDDDSRGEWEIFTTDLDGTNRTRLTTNAVNDWAPSWSPDGGTIAYCSGLNDQYEIWLMDSDGANPRRLTHLVYP
jgi:TolB protein